MHNLPLRELFDLDMFRVRCADTDQLWFEMGTFSVNYSSYATWDYYNLAVDASVDV